MLGYIFFRGLPNLTWPLLSGQSSYLKNTIGIFPNIANTLYIILVAMVIVLPIGVGAAIYLTEYATSHRLVAVIEFATESLAGIPSIIYGLVGMKKPPFQIAMGIFASKGAGTYPSSLKLSRVN